MIRTTRRAGFRLSRSFLVVVLVVGCVFVLLYGRPPSRHHLVNAEYSGGKVLKLTTDLPAANSTLGFGAIAAVSRTNSTRREGLLLAANITELDIVIPEQLTWTDDDVISVKARRGSRLNRGSALAWLGHLNMLRWFLASGLETILILEDDVDWDIHLRSSQVPKVAATIRYLVSDASTIPEQVIHDPAAAGGYWGRTGDWDVLYLGHCGDAAKPGKWNFHIPRASFHDLTLPARKKLEKKTRKLLNSIALPEDVRVVHRSIQPLCTFGFALTRSAARRLLNDIAVRESEGGTLAYDVRVLEACRDLGMRCWSSTPELFHHVHLESEIAIVNGNDTLDAETTTSSATALPTPTVHGPPKPSRVSNSDDEDSDNEEEEEDTVDDPSHRHTDELESAAGPRQQDPLAPPPGPGKKGKKKKGKKQRNKDEAPNIACGARRFRAHSKAEMEKLRQVVGREGRCISQPREKKGG